jgi:hypothetical protein
VGQAFTEGETRQARWLESELKGGEARLHETAILGSGMSVEHIAAGDRERAQFTSGPAGKRVFGRVSRIPREVFPFSLGWELD